MPPLATPQAQADPIATLPEDFELGPSAFERWRPAADTFDAPAFREALKAYDAGRIEDGDALALRQLDPSARLALEWAAIRKAKTRLGFARLDAFLAANPAFPMASWIRRRAEAALFDERRSGSFIRAFFSASQPETAAGRIALARLKREDGDGAGAATLVREAWRDNTLGQGLETAILQNFADTIGPGDIRFRAERAAYRHNLGEALRIGQRIGPDYLLLLRALHASLVEAGNAAQTLDSVPPSERKTAPYALARATLLRRAGKLQEAALAMQAAPRSLDRLVSGEDWWTERRLLARKLLDAGDPATAYAVASGYNATTDSTRIDAEFHAGWIALRFLKDAEAAEVHFERAAGFAKTPLSLARCYYWLGRAREALGQRRRSRPSPTPHASARRSTDSLPPSGSASARWLCAGRDPAMRRVAPSRHRQARVSSGCFSRTTPAELALPLAIDAAQTSSDAEATASLLDLIAGYRDANLLLTVAKAALQSGQPVDRYAFPLFGIPPFTPVTGSAERALVFAIARQESAFDPKAVSRAGARGLMQMMPATASATARQFQLPFALAQLTGEPSANARLGAAHLGHLMQSLRGSYVLVFGGYNAGPGRLKEWIAAYGDPREADVDIVDWIERIPITETRNYVQRVMENFQVYRALLSDDPRLSLRADLARGVRTRDDAIVTGSIGRKEKTGFASR